MEGAIRYLIGAAVLIVMLRAVVTEVNTCVERQASKAESADSAEAISEAEAMSSEITLPPRERISDRNEYVSSRCEESQVYSDIGISPRPSKNRPFAHGQSLDVTTWHLNIQFSRPCRDSQ